MVLVAPITDLADPCDLYPLRWNRSLEGRRQGLGDLSVVREDDDSLRLDRGQVQDRLVQQGPGIVTNGLGHRDQAPVLSHQLRQDAAPGDSLI